jgi:pilus assembly protein CpaC
MPATAPSSDAAPKKAVRARAPRRATGQPASMVKGVVVPVIAKGVDPDGHISLMTFKSVVVATELPYKAVSITNPEVADFNRINDNEILLTAKKPGNTQLMIWNTAGRSQVVDVNVGTDVQALRDQLARIFPKSKIEATNVNGTIVLRGRVADLQTAEQAAAVAKPFAEHVLNMMEIAGGQQVMLQVRFAEVSRAASTELGFSTFATDGTGKFGTINGPGGSPIGGLAGAAQGGTNAATTIGTGVSVFGAGQVGNVAFEYFIQALRRNNLLRILAEPNLVATSGEKASFLAGGEFPVPVPQDSGGSGGTTITIEYKQFGVRLNFLPTVMGDGRVRLDVEPEVSELDISRSVTLNGFVIPSLTKRTLRTTIELRDGQTFAVGGLLNSRVTANKDVTPLLGDLPVLGVLFRSTRYERSETELVVLVTPRLVEGMNPAQVPPLPGERWRHPTESELLLDRDLGGPAATPADANRPNEIGGSGSGSGGGGPATRPNKNAGADRQGAATPARIRGRYGFTPAD